MHLRQRKHNRLKEKFYIVSVLSAKSISEAIRINVALRQKSIYAELFTVVCLVLNSAEFGLQR